MNKDYTIGIYIRLSMSDEDTGAGRAERFSENAKLDCTFLMIMLK